MYAEKRVTYRAELGICVILPSAQLQGFPEPDRSDSRLPHVLGAREEIHDHREAGSHGAPRARVARPLRPSKPLGRAPAGF